jgi:hypothetical protein
MLKEFKLMTLGGYIVIYDATGLSFFIARGTYRALVKLPIKFALFGYTKSKWAISCTRNAGYTNFS